MTSSTRASLLVVIVVGVACESSRPATTEVQVECRPGGRCTSAAAPSLDAASRLFALPELRSQANAPAVRREVRLWMANADPRFGGGLWRYLTDTSGRVTLEHRGWWQVTRRAGDGEPPYGYVCAQILRAGSLRGCLDQSPPGNAAGRLRAMEALGLDSLPGNGSAPDTSACTDMCLAPAHIVVELWTPGLYRSYGAPIPSGPPSAPIESIDFRYSRLFQVRE